MFDYMKNGFSLVTTRLDVVEKDISSLKTDISSLKTDNSSLKTDVSALIVNMNVVNDHMVKVNKYIKLESDFQENSDIAFISKMYLYNHPLRFATVLPIDNFYPPKGNDYITELDGFMLISMTPNQILLWNDTRNNRNINASFVQSLKNNQDKIVYDPTQTEYIIIESIKWVFNNKRWLVKNTGLLTYQDSRVQFMISVPQAVALGRKPSSCVPIPMGMCTF